MQIQKVLTKTTINSLEAQVLLAYILQVDKSYLYAHGDRELTTQELERFRVYAGRIENGKPLAYVLGYKEFYGRDFMVDNRVLIPRPETEDIVDIVVQWCHSNQVRQIRLAEIGVGSGALIITLCLELQKIGVDLGSLDLWGVDISNDALNIACQNAELYRVGSYIKFVQGSLYEPLEGTFDCIVANLPYVPSTEARRNKYEPQVALDGGEQGTELNVLLTTHAPRYLNPGGVLVYEGYGGCIERVDY